MKRLAVAVALLAVLPNAALAHDPKPKAGHAASHPAGHAHAHGLLDVPAAEAPRIAALKAVADAKGGINLYLVTEKFDFAPDLVNQAHVPGKGHAHIYVDGVKVARLYGPAHHLEGLAPGKRRITVTLNANDHREYAVNGKKIAADATVEAH